MIVLQRPAAFLVPAQGAGSAPCTGSALCTGFDVPVSGGSAVQHAGDSIASARRSRSSLLLAPMTTDHGTRVPAGRPADLPGLRPRGAPV